MGAQALHDLTAAYALDALDPDERREYEAHLARCERCRTELASLSEAATALAYGVDAPAPPPQLRERILERARAERPNVVPLRPRWAVPAAAAAVVAVAAVAVLAVWISSLQSKVDRLQARSAEQAQVAAILSAPDARRIQSGDRVRLVVTRQGAAALVLDRLTPERNGIYEAWVATNGSPKPAGVFNSGGTVTSFRLEVPVPKGAVVMVTRERHRVAAPTRQPFIKIPV
jgi:anti-sigma-K factor RskA